jgi:hypothetical protein
MIGVAEVLRLSFDGLFSAQKRNKILSIESFGSTSLAR